MPSRTPPRFDLPHGMSRRDFLTLGTAGFVIASIACWLNLAALDAAGQGWWLGVCLVGVAFGLVGTAVAWTKHRRRKARKAAELEQS